MCVCSAENLFDIDEQLLQQEDTGLPVGFLPDERQDSTLGSLMMAPSREVSYISGVRMVDKVRYLWNVCVLCCPLSQLKCILLTLRFVNVDK